MSHSRASTSTNQPPTDHVTRLLHLIRAGDQHALGQLYDLTAGRVLGLASHLTDSSGEAADVVREVFLEIWRTVPTADPDSSGDWPWLEDIVRRHARRRMRTPMIVADTAEVPGGHDCVRAGAAGLSAQQRRILHLAMCGRLSHEEIGALIELPAGHVRRQLRNVFVQVRSRPAG